VSLQRAVLGPLVPSPSQEGIDLRLQHALQDELRPPPRRVPQGIRAYLQCL